MSTEETPASPLLSPGASFGPYEVIRLLGKGGMGEVYEGRHTTLDESFALKLISREILAGAGSLDRFATEARESFRLKHPHIVRVDNYDMVDGQPYLRMELMPGVVVSGGEEAAVSLEDLLMARGGRLSEAETLTILRDVLAGLAYAHGEGVIHRDLKPANILLYEDGAGAIRAKLADFGLVKAIGEDFIQSRIRLSISKSRVVAREIPGNAPKSPPGSTLDSRELSYIGTYDYMAPEQRDGMEATVRSDLYSVGLITYRMLTGKKVIGMRRLSEMVDGLHLAWDDWVATAADPEPAGRFSSAAEMLQELSNTTASNRSQSVGRSAKPVPNAKRPRPDRPKQPRSSNAPAIAIPLVVLVVSVVGFFGWQAWQNHRAEQQRMAEEEATRQAEQQHRAEAQQASEAALVEASALVEAQDYPSAIAALSELTDDVFVGPQAQSLLTRAEREKADADAAEAERQRLAKLEAEKRQAEALYTEGVAMVAKEDYEAAFERFTDLTENAHVADRALTALDDARRRLEKAEAEATQRLMTAVASAEELLNGQDYEGATAVLQPFAEDAYVGQQAKAEILRISEAEKAAEAELVRREESSLNFLKYKVEKGAVTITKCDLAATEITIPRTIESLPVTTIGEQAFADCLLTSVTIPDSVVTIGEEAFLYCDNLPRVKIPDSVATIGEEAFSLCDKLASIEVSPGNPNFKSLGGVLFSKDGTTLLDYPKGKGTDHYTIPEGVTNIGKEAFYLCKVLTHVTIPGTVTTIGQGAFVGCDGLRRVTIPDSVTAIGSFAFYRCNNLSSVTFEGKRPEIGEDAFAGTPWGMGKRF